MRVIRTIDPLSGKVVQKKITLSSTSGVSVSQHEELPKAGPSDVTVASNQLTRAVYDVRDTMRESNVINYEISKKLKKEISNSSEANSTSNLVIADAIRSNTDKLNEVKDEIKDFRTADTYAAHEISNSIAVIPSEVSESIGRSADNIGVAILETKPQPLSADNLTVTIDGESKTIQQAFTELFRSMSAALDGINNLVEQINNQPSGDSPDESS